ncbi:hypothetical protein Bca101_067322 [Brassica carinata]
MTGIVAYKILTLGTGEKRLLCFFRTKFITYKGRFGVTAWKNDGDGNISELRVWVVEDVEKQKWSKNVYSLPAINELVVIAGANIYRNTLHSVEIQGFVECDDENRYKVSFFVDYVEDLNLNDAKYLNSIHGQNHKENSATMLHL